VGRWLARTYPAIVSPEQWDEELAQTYVTYACGAHIGEDAAALTLQRMQHRPALGRQVLPTTIDNKLQTMRRVFTDWQDRPHRVGDAPPRRLPMRFKPVQAFQTPLHIQRLLQPNPRDIDAAIWWKLMRAAATLTEADLSPYRTYPRAFVSAVVRAGCQVRHNAGIEVRHAGPAEWGDRWLAGGNRIGRRSQGEVHTAP
jgi:hypothetical protein